MLKGLFWIAVSNFVFPVILSIIQLVFIFRDPDFLKGTYIYVTNCFVEIIGVLLATVWTSSSHWKSDSNSTVRGASIENIRFARKNGTSTDSSAFIPRTGPSIQMKTHVETSIDTAIERPNRTYACWIQSAFFRNWEESRVFGASLRDLYSLNYISN